METGVQAIRAIWPPPCKHKGQLSMKSLPTTLAIKDVGLHLRCSVCERKGLETKPVCRLGDL